MFDTAVINYAIISARLVRARAALRRMNLFTRESLLRLALTLAAFASVSAVAHAQANSAAGAATANPLSTLGPSRIYVSDWKGNRVRVFDPSQANGTPYVGSINVGEGPFGMAVSPDQRRLFVANSGSDTVSVIDTRWNVPQYTIGVGRYPIRIAASPDGTRIFVTNFYGNSVSVINVSGNTTPWVERTLNLPYNPMEIAVKPGGRYLYVSQYTDFKIKVFDMWNDFAQVDDISCTALGATQPIAFAFNSDGTRLFVANEGGGPNSGGTVNFINSGNSTANVVTQTVALPYQHLPRGQMVLSGDGRRLFLPGAGQARMLAIDTLNGDVLEPQTYIGVGPHGIAKSPDGSRLYVSVEGNLLSTVDAGLVATQGQNPVLWETYVTPEVPGGTQFLSVLYVTLPACSF